MLSSAVLIDPVSGRTTPTGALLTARAGHTATLLGDGRVLIAGGTTSADAYSMSTDSVEIFDPATGRFSRGGTLMSPRSRHAAVLLRSGKVLICGGLGGTVAPAPPGSALYATGELFDPRTGQSVGVRNMSAQRMDHTATLLPSGDVLVVGLGTADVFLAESNVFVKIPGAMTMRVNHTATLLPDGSVLLAGGLYSQGSIATAELYDAATHRIRPTGSLLTPRTGHAATALADGHVMITGGMVKTPIGNDNISYETTTLSTTEIYDPGAGTFAQGPMMTMPRADHAAVLAKSHVWLIAGTNRFILNSTEAYSGDSAPTATTTAGTVAVRPILHFDVTAGPQPRAVTQATSIDGRRSSPFDVVAAVWSPDGTRFAALSDATATQGAFVRLGQLDRSSSTLYETAAGEHLTGWAPAWSPDGKSIAVTIMSPSSQANGLEYSVVIIDVNSRTVRSRHPIPEGTILVPRHLSPPNTFAWSADNRYLLISWEKAVVLDLDQRRVIPISTQPVVAEWMPGSAAILYFDIANWEKRNEREFGGLYLRRLDNPDRTVIADAQVLFNEGVMLHDAMHHGLLVLSPSRSKMAMVSGTSDKRASMLRIYDVASTATLDLTKPAITTRFDDVIVALEWSPDERSMAALTIPRSATLPKGPFAQPAVVTVNLTTRVPAWQTLTTMNFDLRQGWPDTLELLLLLKPLSWTR